MRKDFNIMNDKFINICDGVNLITAPCRYKNFNLKPGMLLFGEKHGFVMDDTHKAPFVATHEVVSEKYGGDDMGRPKSTITLYGYMLHEDGVFGLGHVDISEDDYSKDDFGRVRNAVDLALGGNKLKRLLLTQPDDRYDVNESFGVYNPKSNFVSTFSHVIGDVYLQKFPKDSVDHLATLSKDQLKAYNEMSPYGIVKYGESSLKITDEKGIHGLLRAYFEGLYTDEYAKEDVVELLKNLNEYCSKCESDMTIINIVNIDEAISYACNSITMPDGFSVKPFGVILEPDDAKSYLDLVSESDGKWYINNSLDNVMVDDNLHNVYLTSIHSGDPDYNDPIVYNGFYFDGERFKHGHFSIKGALSENIHEAIYHSLVESSYFGYYLESEEDFEKLSDAIEERLSDLECDNDYVMRLIEDIYDECKVHKLHMITSPIEYKELTDDELYPRETADVPSLDVDDVLDVDVDLEERDF